jgi:hypothetical protein
MNRHTRDSLVRALCAAAWCLPGALWWAAPVLGAAAPLHGVPFPDPRTTGGLVCGNTTGGEMLRGAVRWQVARGNPALVDSLVRMAERAERGGVQEEVARHALRLTGQPRALRYLAGPVRLAPILVRPGP